MANQTTYNSTPKNTILEGKNKLNLNNSVTSRDLSLKFGKKEDIVELHIYNTQENLLASDYNFTDYNLSEPLSSELDVNPTSILNSKGFTTGQYKLYFNIHRKKILDSESPFSIKEISPSRQELRITANKTNNEILGRTSRTYIGEIESSIFFKEFILNFKKNINPLGVNLVLNTYPTKHELLIKLLKPLPSDISLGNTFGIREEITDPIIINIDLGEPEILDTSIPLKGPNFKIDVRLNNSIPSSFKTYDDILDYSLTSSYQKVLNELENHEIPDISYDYIRPVSESNGEGDNYPTHFENFVHFSSAVERLKNFEYKLKLIELYDNQINNIGGIEGSTSTSISVLNNKKSINDKKTNLLKGLDGYERFLYYTSGSLTWPKLNSTTPYTLYSVSSSEAQTWLGSEKDTYSLYGGQLLSASIFDRQNDHALVELVPKHITDNPSNDFYKTFINMIGQHFDHLWTHIHHLTKINNTHHERGISKDLVYFQLKSLGLETFDQFENSNLIEYLLGNSNDNLSGTVGSGEVGTFTIGGNNQNFYDTTFDENLLITASNEGSLPKGDITKNIWKRLYHNAPYLLKTKGTERGLKALMSCYGVPSTLLNIKEYGGSTSDKTTYQTFSYEKSGLALQGDSGTGGHFIKTNWHSLITNELSSSAKTIEFRIKPIRSNDIMPLISLSGSLDGHTYDQHLLLTPYIGNDISSSGDSTQYGKLDLHKNGAIVASTDNFPIYNKDFWNIFIGTETDQNAATNDYVYFGAYQANFNKNITSHTSSYALAALDNAKAWGLHFPSQTDVGFKEGAEYIFIGGVPSNPNSSYNLIDGLRYSGSLQEVRYYFGELLLHDTLTKHALEPFMYAGNTISSSFENVILRLPLGSNDMEDSSSFHPQINTAFLGMESGVSSSMTTQTWEEVIETHHLPSPDTVGASMTSEKVRIDTGTVNDDILSSTIKSETSTLDRQPQDFEDLGVFFSPTTEINEDIIYTLGAFRLDDYIGSPLPSVQTSSNYADLKDIRDVYFKKVEKKYNYWDYIKLVQQIDHTLFKLIEQWVPMKANLKTGLLIEPHYLERNKFAREVPVIDDGQTMTEGSYTTLNFQIDPERAFSLEGSPVHTNNTKRVGHNYYSDEIGEFEVGSSAIGTPYSSVGTIEETGTNTTINVSGYILDEPQEAAQAPIKPYTTTKPEGYKKYTSNTLLGNALKGKISSRYYRSLDNGQEFDF